MMEKMEFTMDPAAKVSKAFFGIVCLVVGGVGGFLVPFLFGLVIFGISSLWISSVMGRTIFAFSDETVAVRQAPLASVKEFAYKHIDSVETESEEKLIISLASKQTIEFEWAMFAKEDKPLIINNFNRYVQKKSELPLVGA